MTCVIVIGGARCVWEDYERALEYGPYVGVYVTNTMITCWPGRLVAVSLHPEKMKQWLLLRHQRGLPGPSDTVCHDADDATNYKPHSVVNQKTDGLHNVSLGVSSGIYAAMVAALRGHRSVLCGVPMQAHEAHHYDYQKPWSEVGGFLNEFRARSDRLRQTTRSVSGHTMELLGEPDREWVRGNI